MLIDRKPKMDRHINKDVVLCRTTNHRVSNRTRDVLMKHSIPFTVRWQHIPFFKREEFHGASEVCVIQTNRNAYVRARRAIDLLERRDRERLLLNVI